MSAQGEIPGSVRKASILEFPVVTPNEKRLLLPREHGAWALWLLPLISGGIVGFVRGGAVAPAPALWFRWSRLPHSSFISRWRACWASLL